MVVVDDVPKPFCATRREGEGELSVRTLLRHSIRYLGRTCRSVLSDEGDLAPQLRNVAAAVVPWAKRTLRYRANDPLPALVKAERALVEAIAAVITAPRKLPKQLPAWFYAVCHFCPKNLAVEVYRECAISSTDEDLIEQRVARFAHFRRAEEYALPLANAAYAAMLRLEDD